MRGLAWPILSKIDCDVDIAQEMVLLLETRLPQVDLHQILLDIPRTINAPGDAQQALFAVLKCLCLTFPDVGYVQGMSYIAVALMRYTTPENTFAIIVKLFEQSDAKEMFLPDFPGLKKNFYILLSLQKKYMPVLYKKFK